MLAEYPKCIVPHHVELFIDRTKVATLVVACPPPPPPPHNGVTVVSSDDNDVTVHGPMLEVMPGHHEIATFDVETGHRYSAAGTFPVYGGLGFNDPNKNVLSDVFVVITSDQAVRADITVEANIVVL